MSLSEDTQWLVGDSTSLRPRSGHGLSGPRKRTCAVSLLPSKTTGVSRCVRLKRSVIQSPWSTILTKVFFSMTNGRIYQLSNCTYLCRYHLVWTSKYRGKVLADRYIKQELKRIFRLICRWKGYTIHAWHVGDEHIHLFVSIPPKFSVSYAMAILKGKSSAWIKK